ncbi:MAG: Re/Si-specific NAD(P)(+) transhydrogenase subunit alpha [Calditrichaceae bacterium]
MKIGIPKETISGETRVAVVPAMINGLTTMEHEVLVEKGAGSNAAFSDEQYSKAGAALIENNKKLYESSDIILKVQPPSEAETDQLKSGSTLISFLAPLNNLPVIKKLADNKITSFSMEFVPRITRAQSMDALSSMATIGGYKAVLIAANHLGKIFPLMMTAAGSIPPATVLVLGAGVAGLQAIATAKRLGAKVEAFDPRPAVKEQVKSLGAQFVEMELPEEDVETKGGYAKEQSDAFLLKEQEAIAARLPKVDVVITTAQIFGKKAPILITEHMVKSMRTGSVIIDMAAEQGGNCELTEANRTITKHNVTLHGAVNLPATVPVHASQMYSKNITNLVKHLLKEGKFDFEDEITQGACITHEGQIKNKIIADALNKGDK